MGNEGNVQEVFGKFAVEICGKVTLFDSRSEAETQAVLAEQSEQIEAKAVAYAEARELDLEARMTKGKMNVIKDFLAFEATL
jgi:hypothetical protein